MTSAASGLALREHPRRVSPRRWVAIGFIAAAALVGLFATDMFVGRYQAYVIEKQRAAKLELERMAMRYLRADVADVIIARDGKYRVTVYMENVYPEYDLHVMIPPLRVFAQVGPQWKEVPSADAPGSRYSPGNVVHLKGRVTVDRVFETPPGSDYYELIPGYYHILFTNALLVSPVPEPKDAIVERNDTYYVHLLPINADVEDVKRRNQFPGNSVPVFIPMPPH
jgi:hypothetical protein